jgi:hypothetical protein
MYSEARKLEVLNSLKKVEDEATWIEVEKIVNKETSIKLLQKSRLNFQALSDVITVEEAEEMATVIEETSEKIDINDWK